MIHYAIQHFGTEHSHVQWLVRHLLPGNSIDLTLDGDADELARLSQGLPPHAPGLSLNLSPPVLWAGPSLLRQMRTSLARALSVPGWKWFINLSGACLPLRAPHDVLAELRHRLRNQGTHSYCFSFRVQPAEVWIPHEPTLAGQTLLLGNRMPADMDGSIAAFAARQPFNPVTDLSLRRTLHCTEVVQPQRRMQLRGLSAQEQHTRQLALEQLGDYRVGRQWVILHRPVVRWLVKDALPEQVATLLDTTFLPDETFFQTCLAHLPEPLRAGLSLRDNLRGRRGAPGMLTWDEAQAHAQAGALFSRKVGRQGPELRAATESQLWPRYAGCAGQPLGRNAQPRLTRAPATPSSR